MYVVNVNVLYVMKSFCPARLVMFGLDELYGGKGAATLMLRRIKGCKI